jgi:aryl-alcohol dehydrogenase-like predicted oxidoreductase
MEEFEMMRDFTHATLGKTGMNVFRLGLSATYRPGAATIHRAIEAGVNYFFCYGFDSHMTRALREMARAKRESFIVATGAYNLLYGHPDLRRTLEKRLRQLGTDYVDIFLFLGVMKGKQFPESIREELYRFKDEGKIRAVGISCHDRQFAGELAADGDLDLLMIRYNAAHRGAEQDIFPHLAAHNTGLVSYTATRWRYLIRRHKGWPPDRPIPSAGLCYRFVLSNPYVDVCMTAPSNVKQLENNLSALEQGPLSPEETSFMNDYGDFVHSKKNWFM